MFSVVMAGGSGTRFWPLSRREVPKQLLDITGEGPMVARTCERIAPLCRDEELILVLGQSHLGAVRQLLAGRPVHLLGEPVGRNTAPAIGLGALAAAHLGCRGAVAFLPADHYIADPKAFLDALRVAANVAEAGGIVTLGIVPVRPETGYGYIRREAEPLEMEGEAAYRVLEFVEKPDLERAAEYLASGSYYWNAGIFVAKTDTILTQIRIHLPHLHDALMRLAASLGTPGFETALKEIYDGLESVPFDYGIMEKTREPVYVLPCECGWSDVGSWESLYELKRGEHDGEGNLISGDILSVDCRRSFVSAEEGRLVACLGLDNCLVVDTQDILLVADLRRSQEIRKIVDRLAADRRQKYL
jgi:mannose-1-phosphate guanylyltransferase